MNDEYSRGELITDWSTVKQGDIIIGEDDDEEFIKFICFYKKFIFFVNISDEENSGTITFRKWMNFYRAIPKKKKVVKYLYEYINVDGKRHTSDSFYINDNDFKKYNWPITFFHRLDWTAKEFDE